MSYIASNNGQTIYWRDASYQLQSGEVDMGAEYPIASQIQASFPNYELSQAQATQIVVIRQAALVAETAPISFTTELGVAESYSMSSAAWTRYVAAYTRYVVHAQPLPTNFSFYSADGKAVPFSVLDIENLAAIGYAQVEAALAKESSLVAAITAATTVAEVNAVVW